MRIPESRGAASAALFEVFRSVPGTPEAARARAELESAVDEAIEASSAIVRDEDLQLTLFCMYELAYGGIDGVADLEWDPGLIAVRSGIEAAFEAELRTTVPVPPRPEPNGADLAAALFELTAPTPGPSLSRFVAKQATDEQLHEFLVQRSVYTLKEADPHSWAIPRLRGRAKAALVEIQADEYGGGRPQRIHAEIFARTLRGAGLSDEYGHYVDHVPAITLASLNQMSMFGLHRRLRGAVVGHLAAFEMTSALPNRMFGNGFRRLGYDEDVTWYFDEHVEADAVHEQIAARDLAGGLVDSNPELLDDILFGAAASLVVDGWMAEHILSCWTAGRSSLRVPLVVAA
ncbi:iron-containing redox enzyme family protein [Naasia sp. SYSU D00057]|uniref:iron-containing redox enzyme family protein n=1 Tax=Naasia sp. SYSU D00057 TaxID=2817380 RepID=UPI001B306786|nr:iron-containing redox enzyme family protein [Naasia sp. SYSU D00057]